MHHAQGNNMKKYGLMLIYLFSSHFIYAADDNTGSLKETVGGWYQSAKDNTGAAYDATKGLAKEAAQGTSYVDSAGKDYS